MRAALIGLGLLAIAPSIASAAVGETIMVPMRDGTQLETIVWRPSRGGKFGTVLVRTTYGNDFITPEIASVVCDGLKFAFVVQDTRGRYESQGVDDVFLSDGWGENQDGYDTVDWIVNQSWSDGGVGFFGVSALGITSYLGMGSLHPAIKAAHVGIAPWVFYNTVYPGGTFRTAVMEDWLDWQDASYMLDLYYDHPVYDELWASLDMEIRAAEITTPIYHWGGWHDVFTEGPVQGFETLQQGGPKGLAGQQYLLMGPWTHMDEGALSTLQGELDYPANSVLPWGEANPIAWFRRFLQGKSRRNHDQEPVYYYIMGDVDSSQSAGNKWQRTASWPVAAEPRNLYFQEGGLMGWTAPLDNSQPATYLYDPANPSPTIGGHELSLDSGPRDQRPLLSRDDVLVFQTEPLNRPVTVVGDVQAVLFVSSSAPDTDFSVRLVDVYPDGRAMLVTDGIMKARYRNSMTDPAMLEEGEVGRLEFTLGITAQVFDKGHRIMALVSSANYRRFEPSRNTGDGVWGTEPAQVAENSLHLSDVYPSHLVLPEPLAGASRDVRLERAPSPRLIQASMAKVKRGQKLTQAEEEALSFEAGRMLMTGALNTLP